MRRFVYISISGCISVCVLVTLLTLSLRPSLSRVEAPSQADYEALSHFVLSHAAQISESSQKRLFITLTKNALDGGLRVLHKRHPGLRADAVWLYDAIDFQASYHLLGPIWLNTSVLVQFNGAPEISTLKLGQIVLPEYFRSRLVEFLFERLFNLSYRTALDQVESATCSPDTLALTIRNDNAMRNALMAFTRDRLLYKPVQHTDAFNEKVLAFYTRFYSLSKTPSIQRKKHSLAPYLNIVVQAQSQNDASAAIIALALLADTSSLSHVVAQPDKMSESIRFTLWGRNDLAKHFLLSAAIKLLMDTETNLYFTQFKELLDSDGGSGFSFKDIAANRAGARFTDFISHPEFIPNGPYQIDSEDAFLKRIPNLQEHLELEAFALRFHSTDSEEYQKVIHQIDKAIAESALYKN